MNKTRALTIDDYSMEDLLEVARAAKDQTWRLRPHPTFKDSHTVYSAHGYVIHPDLGYVNDDEDAAFIAMFDPAMVLSILERLADSESHDSGSDRA